MRLEPRNTSTERYCKKCDSVKPLNVFVDNKAGKHGKGYTCKECKKPYIKAYALNRKYGLSIEQAQAMQAAQNGCGICQSTEDLVIDHDHQTGALRKLLCRRCNRAIGLFKDDVGLLQSCVEYLKSHQG